MSIVTVKNLNKKFKLYQRPADRLKEIFLRRDLHHTHCALNDISFELKKGEALAVLGQNGAGKSTLLKILTGVLLPDSGQVSIDGKVTALLELGTGFDVELSGYENILSNGLLLGMTRAEIEQQRHAIIEFSELEEYIHEPVRTYSSGMIVRLAFAVAIHASPDCFIVDEALSVGDGHFQQKCIRKIKSFRASGGSILFVSHDLNAVKLLCDRAMVLDSGRIVFDGDAAEGANEYNRIMTRLDEEQQADNDSGYGNGKARIVHALIKGEQSNTDLLVSGETAYIALTIKAAQRVPSLSAGLLIRDRFGQDIFGTNTHLHTLPIQLDPEESGTITFRVPMHLAPGKYTLTFALHAGDNHIDDCFHWCDNLLQFEVAGFKHEPFSGLINLSSALEWTAHPIQSTKIDNV